MNFSTVKQTAEKLKISEQMVRHYIRTKRIKAVRHGAKYVIEDNYLDSLIKKGF